MHSFRNTTGSPFIWDCLFLCGLHATAPHGRHLQNVLLLPSIQNKAYLSFLELCFICHRSKSNGVLLWLGVRHLWALCHQTVPDVCFMALHHKEIRRCSADDPTMSTVVLTRSLWDYCILLRETQRFNISLKELFKQWPHCLKSSWNVWVIARNVVY